MDSFLSSNPSANDMAQLEANNEPDATPTEEEEEARKRARLLSLTRLDGDTAKDMLASPRDVYDSTMDAIKSRRGLSGRFKNRPYEPGRGIKYTTDI